MKKTEVQTMLDNDQQASLRREKVYELLNRIETQVMEESERERACMQVHAQICMLKQEREQMARYMAAESVFVDEAETRLKEIERVNRSKESRNPIKPAPTNAQLDFAERKLRHFAQGKSFYKLFWVFFIGCFAGVIIERIWALIRYGIWEPRVGLVYGPFNLVYGIGAWALTTTLYRFRNRSWIFSFLGGMLIGSVVEYGCSFFQEMLFGSVSWDYSNRPFNLHGRICLLYSVYWGMLGVIWIKDLYPRMARLILKIPNRVGKPLTWMLTVFMILNTLLTGCCMFRWMERRNGQSAENWMEEHLDQYYPNERMEKIFSNLQFTDL